MRKLVMLLGARTPILSIILALVFFFLVWFSAENYYVEKLVPLKVTVESYDIDKNQVVFTYEDNQTIKVGTKIYLEYSKQATLKEGAITKVTDNKYLISLIGLNTIDPRLIKKSNVIIIDGKEPILRRLF